MSDYTEAQQRLRRQALADAWDEGALWAAVETGAISDERNEFLTPEDNPYRAQNVTPDGEPT